MIIPINGPYRGYFENGQKKSEGNYKDGKKNGKWTEWSLYNQVTAKGNYKDDKKVGKWTEWYEEKH